MVGTEGAPEAGERPETPPASPARIDEGSGLARGMPGARAGGQNAGSQVVAPLPARETMASNVSGQDNQDPNLLQAGLARAARVAGEGADKDRLTEAGAAGTAMKGGVRLTETETLTGLAQARSQSVVQSPGALPVQGSVDPFTGDDELILEFSTARGEVTETITGFGTRAATYLPLGEIARLLDLALVVSDDGNYAAGWVLDEKQVVALNLRAGKLTAGDSERTLGPYDAQAFDGELYLRSDLFASLMPLDLKVDLRAQSVTVLTHRPFPFEQRAVRDAARERLAGRSAGRPDNGYVRQETPYRALDVPLGDIEFRAVSDVAQGRRGEADLRLAADFAYMTGQAYVSAASRYGPTAARITLGRRDPDSRLLGALRASAFEIGDVSTEALAMGVRGIAGRGIMVSNAPIERASIFDRIDLRGELPDGYEAELYRNNTLVGSTRTSRDGRYEFLQIPVEFGLNVMRVVLYGPQGQRRETVRQVSVGDGRLATGELRYGFSMAQKDVTLLGLQGPDFVPGRDHGRWRATGQLAYGISSAITASLGAAWYDSETGRQWLGTAGLRTSLGSVASQVNLGFNGQGGGALETRLAATTRGIGWTGTHTEYRGLFSDEVRAFSIEPLRRASEAEITATVRLGTPGQGLTIPVAGRMRRIQFADGKVQLDASLRASTVAAHVLLSNTLSLSRSQAPGMTGTTQMLGSFDLSSLSGSRTRFRASLGYALAPQLRVTQGRVELDRTFGPRTLVKLSAGRTFDTRETTLGTSAVHRVGPFALALDSSITLPRKEHAVVARVGVSFGRNPVSQSWFLAQPGLAAGGAVAASAFVDANGNQQRDRDEALVDDVEFDTGTQVARSNRAGVALLGQLGNANRTFLRLNAESLPDLAMAPAAPGFEFVPRPGRIHVSQFAIDTLGEIEGIAVFGAEQRGVSGLVLTLVDASGRQVGRVRTSGGGTFLFEQVRPGTYRVLIDPGQAKRLALVAGVADAIVLDGKQQVIRVTLPVHKQESP
ncbi:hypothetical protein OVA07_00520 [Novosphingobium sp. SL115]|uniref:carboxypeptidase-like regulatory domain-containing protein n=1 Tax=Novosphingobium sp. SL115 TaxID=2995150 RepID=UPI0022732034|nr:hypothetical protein [Novosphingobium sp. SL115]MCY1669497.1 hypothetical protein [Novosphingobium sp. SL115]